MSEQGKLMVISGFSGVGKGTVIKQLMEHHPNFVFSVSGTTRYMRDGEVHGVHYFFMSREEFEDGIDQGKFLEHAQYAGNYYGTPRDYVFSQMEQGNHVVLDIEVQGALQVKKAYEETQMLYLIPPSAEVLVRRLTGRGTETAEQVKARLGKAIEEIQYLPSYENILVNDTLDATEEAILTVAAGQKQSAEEFEEKLALARRIGEDLKKILETM